MSRQIDGTFACDRCGADIGNGGIEQAVTISDLEVDEKGATVMGVMRILHLCRANHCNNRVLTRRALAALHDSKETTP